MMINCPRCGFNQPKDQYCAQCGVDIEKFKPGEVSKVQKIAKNPILQISIISFVTLLAAITLYNQNHFEFVQRVKFFSGQLQVSSSQNSSHINDSTKLTEPSSDNQAINEQSESVSTPQTAEATLATTSANPPPPASNEHEVVPSEATALAGSTSGLFAKVQFYEVPIKIAQRFYIDSQATGQFSDVGGYTAGVLPDSFNKIDGAKTIKLLQKLESPIEVGHSTQWFLGLHNSDPEKELGLAVYVELTDYDGSNVRGNIEVLKSWKESTETSTQKSSYPAIFELNKTASFFLSAILPHRTSLENDEAFIKAQPFSILRSQNFKANQSELFILVTIEKR